VTDETKSVPVTEEPPVQKLLEILEGHNLPSWAALLAVLVQVGKLEGQLTAAVTELAGMRQELESARQKSHPAKEAMQTATDAVRQRVTGLRNALTQRRRQIASGCKTAVTAFQSGGVVALNNIAQFFRFKPMLESMYRTLDKHIRFDNKAIAQIEAACTEYHEAGRHVANIGRAILGKEALSEPKPIGRVAKSMVAPFHAARSCFTKMQQHTEAALGGLTQLETQAAECVSVREAIQAHREQMAEAKRTQSVSEKHHSVENER